jgi:hypothetical protein
MSASLRAQRAAVAARLDAKATQYRDAVVKDGAMRRRLMLQMWPPSGAWFLFPARSLLIAVFILYVDGLVCRLRTMSLCPKP